ncbi:MAG TPA: DNA repair protein RecO [Candidatus Saccharimonadales bacterium]|nr:DNA repair protein RecO [Candidatus Saccharimonadales bacterium]
MNTNQATAVGIVLKRTNYGEADRIVTMVTPDQGKLRLMARGVRRVKSKLAGGIELFSVSELTYIRGRGDIGTLVSARLSRHYGRITGDLRRVQLGYDLIKTLDKITEDAPEPAYFHLLEHAFAALDDVTIDEAIISLWFDAQLLRLGGHGPNLQTDTAGSKLIADGTYAFDYNAMAFRPVAGGPFEAAAIKFLRLTFAGCAPKVLQNVQGSATLAAGCIPLVRSIYTQVFGL